MDMPPPPPGGPGAPPPGMPPGMPGAPPPPPPGGGTGPVAAPGHPAGNAQQGMTSVKLGLEAFQKALPQIPLGSKLHAAVMKAVSDISKHMNEEGGGKGNDPSAMIQQLMELARNAKANPNAQAAMPGGAPPGGAPGGAPQPQPPAMPPMGG